MEQKYKTLTKICGITNIEDARVAEDAGAYAIGLVFYKKSPRYISIDTAKEIVAHINQPLNSVGLFVDADRDYICSVLEQIDLDILQFHGQESEQTCAFFNKPYIKAIRVSKDTNILKEVEKYSSAKAILLDTHVEGLLGGTGKVFDWTMIPRNLSKPIILAGGLNVDNVKDAIRKIRPYAVDVSGGVESEKGKKDPKKIKDFINEAINA
jgi:phosphoribosylanthranilate isomerase|tara:strand:+ start:1247 stop:1876 length:630 start_codon:yes stop_codon:yes gene_type:complete